MHPQAPRSAIPRVIGIIGLPFACIGIGASLLFTFGPLHDIKSWGATERLGSIVNWLYIWLAVSVLLFAAHLLGSILTLTYRASGPRLLTGYAVGAIALLVIDVVMMIGFVPNDTGFFGVRESVTWPRVAFGAIAFPWPVVVLALVNTPRARAACS